MDNGYGPSSDEVRKFAKLLKGGFEQQDVFAFGFFEKLLH